MKRHWLRDWRRRAKLTQSQLAERIGCPQNYISRWERGTEPSIGDALALARELGVPVERIRFGNPEPETVAPVVTDRRTAERRRGVTSTNGLE